MGCYINPKDCTKEEWLWEHAPLSLQGPRPITETHVPICWVHNGGFTAAGVGYSAEEVARFSDPADPRPKVWFYAPRAEVRKVSDLATYEAEQ